MSFVSSPHEIETSEQRRSSGLLRAVGSLVEAERDCHRIGLLSESMPDLVEAEAYWVARRVFELKDEPVCGYKLGYTNSAIREQMNIHEPNFGRYSRSAALTVTLNRSAEADGLFHPRIEPEITLVFGRTLCGPDVKPADVAAAVKAAYLSYEIVDSRYQRYSFTARDNIADNSSAARYLIGPPIDVQALVKVSSATIVFFKDAEEIERNVISGVWADMCSNVAWLANKLAVGFESIESGAFVMTGALTRAHPLEAAKTYKAEIAGIGSIECSFNWKART